MNMSKQFAVIENETIVNTIIADSLEIAESVTGLQCVEYTEENPAAIGWLYDGVSFVEPVVEESPAE